MTAHRRVCATSGASLPPDKAIEKAGSISAARRERLLEVATFSALQQPNDGGDQRMNSTKTAANPSNQEEAKRNLVSISPFFIVKNLQASIAYYIERLGFQLDFTGPADDPFYAGVSRDGIGIMLKAILPDVLPCPNHTRHEWARWDAYIYTLDPDVLFDEFSQRGVSFVKKLSFIDEGLWGFELTDADGYVLAFFRLRNS